MNKKKELRFLRNKAWKKRKGEDERPHKVLNEILVQRKSANPSGRLKKYEPLDTRDFVLYNAFTELSIANIKKLVNVSTICRKTLVMFKYLTMDIPVPGQNNSKEKSFIFQVHTAKENVTKEIRLRVTHLLKSVRYQPNMQPLCNYATKYATSSWKVSEKRATDSY